MPTLRRYLVAILIVLWATPAWAATTHINFIGPKVTNSIEWTPAGAAPMDVPIVFPQDFSVYPFLGGDPLKDAVVPAYWWHVLGLENLNTWEKLGPNEFWTPNLFGDDDHGAFFFQALNGDFDNNGKEDIVLIPNVLVNFNAAKFHVCFDFTGTSCASIQTYTVYKDPGGDHDDQQLIPVYGDVGDINGDGVDDLGLVTWARHDNLYTYYVGLTSSDIMNIAAENYKPVAMERFHGTTLALGDYDNDNKLDAAIAGFNHDASKGVLHTLIAGEGMAYDPGKGNVYDDCQFPTGLESYDPDSSNFDDLVLTCMIQRDGNTIKGGPVKILTNQGGAGHSFNVAQNLVTPGEKGLNYPTRTAVGDFNEDNQPDLVVAEPGSRKVLVYEGVGPFAVDADTRRDLESAPYPSTFIQVHDFNGDGKQDIITTATLLTSFIISSLDKQSNVANSTAAPRPWSRLCVSRDFAQRAEGKNPYLTEADGLRAFAGAGQAIYPVLNSTSGTASAYTQQINRTDFDYSIVNAEIVRTPPANRAVDSIAVTPDDIKQCDGVLVWLNFSPTVNLGDVDCDTQEIDFSCTASPGTTIKKCEASSADFTVELTQTPNAGNNWTGKIKAPTGITQYKITVTATSETGGGGESTQTGVLDVNLGDCGGPAGCPESEKVVTVWPTEPFSLCAPDSLVQKAVTLGGTVEWEQTGGAPLLVPAEDKNFAYKNIQFNGNCLSGSFALDANSAFIKEDFTFVYRVNLGKGQTLECPAKLTKLQAQVEGSGTCALNPAANVSAGHFAGWLFLTLSLLFYGVRRARA